MMAKDLKLGGAYVLNNRSIGRIRKIEPAGRGSRVELNIVWPMIRLALVMPREIDRAIAPTEVPETYRDALFGEEATA